MTGEHSALITVWNVSHTRCRLPTYPRIWLLHGQRHLPFHFQHGGMYVQDRPRGSASVAMGAAENFIVAKYRCDAGISAHVTGLEIDLVATKDVLRVAFPAGYAGPTMDYCKPFSGPASSDPGNKVEMGPYQPGVAHGT